MHRLMPVHLKMCFPCMEVVQTNQLDNKSLVYTALFETPDPGSRNQPRTVSAPTPLLGNNSLLDTASDVLNSPDSNILSDRRFDLKMSRSDNTCPPGNSPPSSIPEHYFQLYLFQMSNTQFDLYPCTRISCSTKARL